MSRALRLLSGHWYAPLLGAMLVAIWLLARTPTFMQPGGEAALLADLCLTAPLLYLLCYGRRQPVRKTLVRALAIACAGVWLGSLLIPAEYQSILPKLTPLRWVGLVVVTLFEIRLVVAATRIAFSGKGTTKDVMEASDAPKWIAKLMLLEARFWRAVWQMIRVGNKREP